MSKKTSLMIVEDDAVIAISTRMVLEELGYAVSSIYDSGEEAIEKFEKEQPDVVLIDVNLLGDMSGLEAAEHITSTFHTPVILLTAYYDETTLRQAKAIGVQYLRKPAYAEDFQSAIEQAMNRAA